MYPAVSRSDVRTKPVDLVRAVSFQSGVEVNAFSLLKELKPKLLMTFFGNVLFLILQSVIADHFTQTSHHL